MTEEARAKMRKLMMDNKAAWTRKTVTKGKVPQSMRDHIPEEEPAGEFTNDCLAPNKHKELL